MNSSSVKVKFQMGQFKSLKLIFCKLKCQYDLENHGQGHQFSNTSEIFKYSMNSLSVKAKFQIGQFKSVKQKYYKFEAQSDLEGQCQGHKYLK